MFRHPQFINILCKVYKPQIYLELGIYNGETITGLQAHCKRRIGVDVNPLWNENKSNFPGIEVYETTTDDFFINFKEKVDFVFIDADHNFESVKKDFLNSVKILNPGGVIVLHDTDPIRDNLLEVGLCSDSFKMVKYLESQVDFNCVTIPVYDEGLTIVTRKNENRVSLRKGAK